MFFALRKKTAHFSAVILISLLVCSSAVHANLLSGKDKFHTYEALENIKKTQWKAAANHIAQSDHALSHKLYKWLYYTKNGGPIDFREITLFIKDNPDWPMQGRLRLRAEQAITSDITPPEIIRWFHAYAPITADGMNHYLTALKATKRHGELKLVFRDWWAKTLLTPKQQARFLINYGAYLNRQANINRINTQITAGHYTNARKIAYLLGQGYPEMVRARIALREDQSRIDQIIAAVPSSLTNDPGFILDRISWRRRHNKEFSAIDLFEQAAAMQNLPISGEWWKERHIIARRLIEKKQYNSAYKLVKNHLQTDGFSYAQAEFLAGWLSLSFLNNPRQAYSHFVNLYSNVSTPISKSRGAYWAGRASQKNRNDDIAKQWYAKAATYKTSFYGQCAADALQIAHQEIKAPPTATPTLENKAAFYAHDMVQVAKMLSQTKMRKEAGQFLDRLADILVNHTDHILLADLSRDLDQYQNAVRIAKKSLKQNILMIDHAYPTILSRMRHIDLEWALAHAIIRQESAFDFEAKSPAGARGLMQLMPGTAHDMARELNIPHKTSWLTTNTQHNIKLGAAYMQKMLDRYNGSYPMAIAAYNGGPGRVDRWIEDFGDPRTGEIDLIDWMELIPIYETRNYVQRVLENVHIYRLKLKDVQKGIRPEIHINTAVY